MATEAPPSAQQTAVLLDEEGVLLLHPPQASGSSYRLGQMDPNHADALTFEVQGNGVTGGEEAGLRFWTVAGKKVGYASGAPDGLTVRLNVRASGGKQTFTWKSGAVREGYVGNPRDLKNFEGTVYVRVRGSNGTHSSMSWKLRGGKHSGSDAALASCVGMNVPHPGDLPHAYRELDHPQYAYVDLQPKFPYEVEEGKWLGVKVVSYLIPGGTRNNLFLDTEPFDAQGKPQNHFRLFTEWDDLDGVAVGRYTQAATWAGWTTTFRVDGWKQVDFAHLSVHEIVPPAAP